MNFKNLSLIMFFSITSVALLIYGRSLLIPFIFSALLCFIIRRIRLLLDKIPFILSYIPNWLKNLVIAIAFLSALNALLILLVDSITELANSYKNYESNVTMVLNKINGAFNIDLIELGKTHLGKLNFTSFLSLFLNALTDILSNSFLVVIYAIFLLIEENYFHKKLQLIFNKKEQYRQIKVILGRIEKMLAHYLGLKTFVSILTGTLSYFILLAMGIESPEFWAFLIFLLNYIPTIGSIIGTAFPVFFSLLQFGQLPLSLLLLIFLGSTQVLVGNIFEPRLMGNSLNISSLVAILSLSFWGSIWGITGMILSIPITVIAIILLSQFEKTKGIAILLSEKGDL